MLNKMLRAGITGTIGTRNLPVGGDCWWAMITKRPVELRSHVNDRQEETSARNEILILLPISSRMTFARTK